MAVKVKFAVYGALASGNENLACAQNVALILDLLINSPDGDGKVKIDNDTMGGDPCPHNTKHFGAEIEREEITYCYACQEGQTIDFFKGGTPAQ